MQEEEQLAEELITSQEETKTERLKRRLVIGVATLLTLILFSGIVVGGLLLAPLESKVKGTWVSVNDPTISLDIENNKVTLKIADVQGQKGFTSSFEANLKGEGSNHYVGENTLAYLSVARKELTDEAYQEILAEKKNFKVVEETKERVKVSYTDEAIKQMYFETNGINHFFDLTLQQFKGLKGEVLVLRNDHFAANGLEFKRAGEESKE